MMLQPFGDRYEVYMRNRLRKKVESRAKTVPSAAKAGHSYKSLTDGLKAVPFKA